MDTQLVFLKLGGSLITDKTRPHTPRLDVMARLADEIAVTMQQNPQMRLLIGHGSGSFAHVPARRYATHQGVYSQEQWKGFVEVWREAAALNRLVLDALSAAGLPAIAFAPVASVTASSGRIYEWNLAPIRAALAAHLLPVVYGDVVFDAQRGGGILSTEDLFAHLALNLYPERILLAGREPGVWQDFPHCTAILPSINRALWANVASGIGGSAAVDVTGGMIAKVQQSLRLVEALPGLEISIFSGEIPGSVQRALAGEAVGTRISDESITDKPE